MVAELANKGKNTASGYPKKVRACNVVNGNFAPGLFMLEGGRAKYDEVCMRDGGRALYLARVEEDRGDTDDGLAVKKRWIPWNTKVIQMFGMKSDTPYVDYEKAV